MNFLDETKRAILNSGHNFKDVMFIGSADGKYRIDWENFIKKANFNYDNSWGSAKIAIDLIIYFTDESYITRWEYDGSEGWEYNIPKKFSIYDDFKTFETLGGNHFMWKTVEEMNDKEKYDEEGYDKE